MDSTGKPEITNLSTPGFLVLCLILSLIVLGVGASHPFPVWVLVGEVGLMILSLFVFGSIRYRLDKNAITYGMALVVSATFWTMWWPNSGLRLSLKAHGAAGLWGFAKANLLSFRSLDALVHADTMLFILGLTLFVSVITQTRLLESASFAILRANRGKVATTVALIAALVAVSSGVLDGVSMIGLLIRTLVIILLMARTSDETLIYIVIISTVVTTVCGMWLAYGEPPNLIMKANLFPYLNDAFFLRYCLPIALASFLVVAWSVRRKLAKRRISLDSLDFVESQAADVRFLQAERHGKVLDHLELLREHQDSLGEFFGPVHRDLHMGLSLGEALVRAGVPREKRKEILGVLISDEIAGALDHYYVSEVEGNHGESRRHLELLKSFLGKIKTSRVRAQRVAALSFVPFIGLLVWHALHHGFPLFPASFAGFVAAVGGIFFMPKMRRLAFSHARREYAEYLFLIPLFFCITLLQKAGFFVQLTHFLRSAITTVGASPLAAAQFGGATLLSAILDNNVVADFAARAIKGMDVKFVHFFAMAQIAGYAIGGCWTHIGSAQSVLAYSFIRKEIRERFTPFQWIKAITPVILALVLVAIVIIFIEGWLMG